MAVGDETPGRRLPDCPEGKLLPKGDFPEPGDYWRVLGHESQQPGPENLTGTIWGICAPRMEGIGILTLHTVREEEDGTISVRPGDGSSNSILTTEGEESWHGYIEHGVWREC